MTRINLTDERGLKTAKWFNRDSSKFFEEETRWDGSNWVSEATGSRFYHEGLYITPKKRFILNTWSNFQNTPEKYIEISKEEAVEWLIRNNYYEEVEEAYKNLLEEYEV